MIEWLHKLFNVCQHELSYEDKYVTVEDRGEIVMEGYKRFVYCRKCGYMDNHWKFH